MSNRRIVIGLILTTFLLVINIIFTLFVQDQEIKQGRVYSILALVCFFIYFLIQAIQKRK